MYKYDPRKEELIICCIDMAKASSIPDIKVSKRAFAS